MARGEGREQATETSLPFHRYRVMDDKSFEKPTYDEPSSVAAEQGDVIVDGPDAVALTITPEAARETAKRLLEQAEEAEKQSGGPDSQPR